SGLRGIKCERCHERGARSSDLAQSRKKGAEAATGSNPCRSLLSPHNHYNRPIRRSFQAAQTVLDVFEPPQLAGPTAGGQLTRGVLWMSVVVGEQSDLLKTRFQLIARGWFVSERGERLLKGVERFKASGVGRPVFFFDVGSRPPPLVRLAGGPGDAVVAL